MNFLKTIIEKTILNVTDAIKFAQKGIVKIFNAAWSNPDLVFLTLCQIFVPLFGIVLSAFIWLVKAKAKGFSDLKLWITPEKPTDFSIYLILQIIYSIILVA